MVMLESTNSWLKISIPGQAPGILQKTNSTSSQVATAAMPNSSVEIENRKCFMVAF
jgi:hypothetical protein